MTTAHAEHPRADLTTVHDASSTFLELTREVAHAGGCGPSTLVD